MAEPLPAQRPVRLGIAALFLALALVALPFSDLEIAGHDPGAELGRLASGLLRPQFGSLRDLGEAALLTVAFALCGVALGGLAGFALSTLYEFRLVRALSVAVRSIHELFWALLLLQVTGLSATTGILAIAIPYSGIFAKVFSEYQAEADPRPSAVLARGTGTLSRYFYARLPLASREMRTYLLYRFECALRSSAVLGFVGLPTLGFQLDSFFRQGHYGEVATVLLVYYGLVASMRHWMRRPLVPLYLALSAFFMLRLSTPPMADGALLRFLTLDVVPAPLRGADLTDPAAWAAFASWLGTLVSSQALPGIAATLVVSQLALLLAAVVALGSFPLLVPRIAGPVGSRLAHLVLVVARSTPEYMLAYIALQIFGPSMLPAVLALGLHNGAIIAHLLGQQAGGTLPTLRPDAPRGIVLFGFELLPRLYGSFLALCLYRWEIIVRESAIVGLLGIATLGFFVDRAIQEIRIDRAVLLLLAAMLTTAAIDLVSRRLRQLTGLSAVVVVRSVLATPAGR